MKYELNGISREMGEIDSGLVCRFQNSDTRVLCSVSWRAHIHIYNAGSGVTTTTDPSLRAVFNDQ